MVSIKNILPSIIRTWVPLIVGWLLTFAFVGNIFDLLGVPAEDRTKDATAAVTVVITGLYYLIVRLVEEHQSWFGWLLGLAKTPAYATHVGDPAPVPVDGGNAEDAVDDLAPDDAGGHVDSAPTVAALEGITPPPPPTTDSHVAGH